MNKAEYWLSKTDFDALDNLIGKHGFGGYYDMLECLKTIISKVDVMKSLKKNWRQTIKTIPDAIFLLLKLSDY